MGKKVDLQEVTLNMAWLLVSDGLVFQNLLICWDVHEQVSLENVLKKRKYPVRVSSVGQGRVARLVRADRKDTETQITTHYNRGLQKSISECTTCRTMKQMGYSSRRHSGCYSCQLGTGN